MKNIKHSTNKQYKDDDNYKWLTKYDPGSSDDPNKVFTNVKGKIIKIIEYAESGEFDKIDNVDYNSLPKWKIAFIYSGYKLLPVYSNAGLRVIAKNFEHPYYDIARTSELSQFILSQKKENEDIYDFAFNQYHIATKELQNKYYIVGTKYRDENEKGFIDMFPKMHENNVISIGYFEGVDLSHLFGVKKNKIDKWLDKNLKNRYPKRYETAKSAISHFLSIKEGDIIALKSEGGYGNLTIRAYAKVISLENQIYSLNESLGHCLNVSFLETDLKIETGLSYGNSIHLITPGQKKGHFEKIFGSYSVLEKEFSDENDGSENEGISLNGSNIKEKQLNDYVREAVSRTLVKRTHDKLQINFAHYLDNKYSEDDVETEIEFIDVVRESNDSIYYYEVKPFNSVYKCIRAGIGQLLDYCNKHHRGGKTIHLCIVGPATITQKDQEFIDFIKKNLRISFSYIQHNFQPLIDE